MPQTEREKLLEKRARLDARLKALAVQDQRQKRKDDTRRKVIAGALCLEHAETHPEFAAELRKIINRFVTRPQDRALFDFLGERDPEQSRAAENPVAAEFSSAAIPAP